MKLEVGKYYKLRNGEIVGPLALDESSEVYPFCSNGRSWTIEGKYNALVTCVSLSLNIIALVNPAFDVFGNIVGYSVLTEDVMTEELVIEKGKWYSNQNGIIYGPMSESAPGSLAPFNAYNVYGIRTFFKEDGSELFGSVHTLVKEVEEPFLLVHGGVYETRSGKVVGPVIYMKGIGLYNFQFEDYQWTPTGKNGGDASFDIVRKVDDIHDYYKESNLQVFKKNVLSAGINELVQRAHGDAVAAGWYTDLATGEPVKLNVGEHIALMHSELSEAFEAARKGLNDDHLPHRRGIEVELADCIIRICDFAGAEGLDLPGAILEKMEYNRSRKDHKLENRKADNGKKF